MIVPVTVTEIRTYKVDVVTDFPTNFDKDTIAQLAIIEVSENNVHDPETIDFQTEVGKAIL